MSSAKNFSPDYTTTFSISHPEENGIVTIGSPDWRDYSVTSKITFMRQDGAGIAARSRGHRRYYAAIISGPFAQIVMRKDGELKILARHDGAYRIDSSYEIRFTLRGKQLCMFVAGKKVLEATDGTYDCGAAGFLVNTGAILVDGMIVEAVK
jgi:hypothetical protein